MSENSWIPEEIRRRARILVVEDNVLNQKLDSFLLSGWGLKHDICDNGRKAIERLMLVHFDVVLMDIRMPELDGYEATKMIREELKLDVPVIGITAQPDEEEKKRCLKAGMSDYISKPLEEKVLRKLLRNHLVPEEVKSAEEEE